ncbi:MAG TPA: GNAT family N-acetyltransferase [Pyrinomonadaceae bacterium]|nr:GNAT family N-acetyltransferase [Pyrinomonadaceae bacterium]
MIPTVRLATSDDIDSIQNIFEAATSADGRQEDWARLIESGGLVVAETNDAVVGFGGIDVHSVEQVKWLYVLPEHQGSGAGSKILEQLEEIGWNAGFTVLRLHSAPSAEQFYRKHGYESVEPHETIGHDHDGVELMKRRD